MPMAPHRRQFPPSLKLMLAGVLVSVLVAAAWQQWLKVRTHADLKEQAAIFESRISTRMESFLTLLRGATGLYAASERVTTNEFHSFTTPLDLSRNYPGMLGIGFSQRIKARQLAEATEVQLRDRGGEFRIWPAHEREEYHAIIHLEPQNRRNRAAIGYDMFTEPVRRAAMERAWTSGRAAMSGTVTLVQEIDAQKQPGFLIYHPVYQRGAHDLPADMRYEELIGFVYSPFRIGDFLSHKVESINSAGVVVGVYDHPQP